MIVHKLRPVAMALLVLAAVTSLADDGDQLDLDANHAASKPGSTFSLATFVAEVTPGSLRTELEETLRCRADAGSASDRFWCRPIVVAAR